MKDAAELTLEVSWVELEGFRSMNKVLPVDMNEKPGLKLPYS